ncbi:MAG: hypothetical protein VX910_01400 [Candidatus Latescibacterota bacterium]|nr:hypothetical protein [Candidatus Latescibacterota bacterium]
MPVSGQAFVQPRLDPPEYNGEVARVGITDDGRARTAIKIRVPVNCVSGLDIEAHSRACVLCDDEQGNARAGKREGYAILLCLGIASANLMMGV